VSILPERKPGIIPCEKKTPDLITAGSK
jgi:hypothetical protein